MQQFKSLLKLFVGIGLLLALGYALLNHQKLIDEWRLYNYDPPKEIVQLADNTTMKDQTRRIFYVNHPSIEGKQAFRESCQGTERTIVLGCYVSGNGIYLLRVTDDRLNGIHEVTAAHEVLHAVYERLSGSEQERVDRLTEEAVKGVDNERILKTISQYEKNEPDVVPNELHSILATEVRELPRELDKYYKQYFSNRQKIVEYSEQYQEAFNSRQERADNLLEEMNSIRDEINQNEQLIQSMRVELNSQYETLESSRADTNPEEFNAQVENYNSRVNEFNSLIESRNSLADEYNSLREEYNNLVIEEKELIEAIDSSLQAL